MLPPEGFQPTVSKLVQVLERLQIRFHLTGGIVSVAYGEPRLTQDVDVVLDRDRVLAVEDEFLGALAGAGFHFSEPTARQSIESRQMFAFLRVTFVAQGEGRSTAATAPSLVTSNDCTDCASYNCYPDAQDDLCRLLLPGRPIMYVESKSVPVERRSWGALRLRYH